MNNKAVTQKNSPSHEDMVLNAGRVDTGKVDVDKTLELLNDALGGQLFPEQGKADTGSKPEDEVITVQGSHHENVEAFDNNSLDSVAQSKQSESSEIESLASSSNKQSKLQGKDWLSRLTAKITKRAS